MTTIRNQIVKREITFCFAHRLFNDTGPCRNMHGHEPVVTIEVAGPIKLDGANPGMLIPFATLKGLMNTFIHDLFDHMTVLRWDDPVIEDDFDKATYNNAGWEAFIDNAKQSIQLSGYFDTRGQSPNPIRNNLAYIMIAEDPTSENLAYLIHRLLSPQLYAFGLTHLRVTFQETRKCGAIFSDPIRQNPDFPRIT